MNQIKKVFAILLLCVLSINFLPAQVYVARKNVNQMEEVAYIELIMDRRAFRGGLSFAIIDYGQLIRQGTLRNNRITDKEGNHISFKGEMDIFNFLFKNGWIHETTYAKEELVYHIFRRKGMEK